MTPTGILKNNFQPAGGVKEPSLFHCNVHRPVFWLFLGQNMAEIAHKPLKVSVSEHTYPVSILFLDFDWMGGLVLTGKVKIAQREMFTSEGQSSLERMGVMPAIILLCGVVLLLWVAMGLGAVMARKEGER